MAPTNLLYYSTNTYLSYLVNRRFYGGQHYVWASPVFNPSTLEAMHEWRNIPASSSPHDIYVNYRDSTSTPDRHSDLIRQNIRGIKRGALKWLSDKKIDENQYQMIMYMVKHAQKIDFRPLVYLIPASLVVAKIKPVDSKLLANPLGPEYRIFDLMENEFEVLEFKR